MFGLKDPGISWQPGKLRDKDRLRLGRQRPSSLEGALNLGHKEVERELNHFSKVLDHPIFSDLIFTCADFPLIFEI